MSSKLIIDADPGIGDTLALVIGMLDPDLDVIAVTGTPGCVSGEQASQNIQKLVGLLDPPKWPRLGQSSGPPPITHVSGYPSPSDLNGPSGLGDLRAPLAELHQPTEADKLIGDMVKTFPDEVTLLTLGPLTNLELAWERYPELLSQLKALVCLGGAVKCGGDVTAAAEFNMYADPEAARVILRAPCAKTLVPLDVCNRVTLSLDQFDRLDCRKDCPLGQIVGDTLHYSFRAHHEHLGQEQISLRELAALAAVARPDLFESRRMCVDVETSGELTRGMTVFDRRNIPMWQSNIDVLMNVDPQGVVEYLQSICRLATQR